MWQQQPLAGQSVSTLLRLHSLGARPFPVLQSTGRSCTSKGFQRKPPGSVTISRQNHSSLERLLVTNCSSILPSAFKTSAHTECSLALGTSVWLIFTKMLTGPIYDPAVSEPKQALPWWLPAWQSSLPFSTLIISACDRGSQLGQADRPKNPRGRETKQGCWLVYKTSLSSWESGLCLSFTDCIKTRGRKEETDPAPKPPSTNAASPPVLTPWHLLSPGTCVWGYGNAGARPPAGSPVGSVPHGEALRCPRSQRQAVQLAEGAHQTPQYPLEMQILDGGEKRRDLNQGKDSIETLPESVTRLTKH